MGHKKVHAPFSMFVSQQINFMAVLVPTHPGMANQQEAAATTSSASAGPVKLGRHGVAHNFPFDTELYRNAQAAIE
ncbi:hypothetical protein PS1_010877 [Malus domestica]